jgi:tetratricopeptide (TPR) repeat protein
MAEVEPSASQASPAAGARSGAGLELRLERGGVRVRLGRPAPLAGLLVEALDLAVPDVALPFDVGLGPAQFQHRLCDLVQLAVVAVPEAIAAAAARLDLAGLGLASLEVALRDGFAELSGRLAGGPPFALRIGVVPGAERGVAVVPYAPRLLGPSALPAAALPHLAARALAALGLPDDPLPLLLRRVLVARGWKVPRDGAVRLAAASVTPAGVRLAWDRDPPGPPASPADPDLLAAVEGARAFAEAEALVAAGDYAAAREAYLGAAAAPAHPFAADRLLSLLVLDDRFHDEALDLAADWLARRPGFAPALAAEAAVRAQRGEPDRAARALAALAEGAVAAGERLAAAAAAEAALALPGAGREATSRAVDAALAVRRDHLPALRALRTLAQESGDKGAQLRAIRRLLAYAPTDGEKARAHAELAQLLLDKDPPAARLHLDRALRLAPGDAESLATLARACAAAGDHLRAVRTLDRLRALELEAGHRAAAAALALEVGALWEERLGHLENALLRYREAAELGPGAAEAHGRAAACAARLGRWTEAADHHAAALALLDRGAPGAAAAAAAHHLALADVAEQKLDDPAGAATHLEAALAGLPPDRARLERLAALHRRLGRPAELLATLDRLAPLVEPDGARALVLAEAGDLVRGPLGRPDAAAGRYGAALALDPACRPALAGLAEAAAAKGDAAAEREALARLVPLARDRAEEAALQDRLAAASDRAGDLAGAARAVAAARRAEPSRPRLAAAVALARRAGDQPELAGLLDELARSAAGAGDAPAAAVAWRERAELLEAGDPALALAALAEARALLPGDAGLLRRQASLAERAGEPHLALGALRALLATAPADAPALELRAGRAALAAGAHAEAREHGERALAAGAPGALELLAEALERSGDQAGRAALLTRLGRHLEAAALRQQAGDLPGALEALAAAAGDERTASEALPRLADLRERGGDLAGAARALVELARRTGGRDGALLALRAHALAPSAAALDAAVAADPAYAPPRALRALAPGAEPRAALADAEAALAGEGLDPPRRPELLRLAARLAAASGDLDAARRHLAAWCRLATPADADLAELAALERAAGDGAALATTLARRLESAPAAEAVALRLELAPLLAAGGREPEAVAAWREALARDPAALPALLALLDPIRAAALGGAEREALEERLAGLDGAPPEARAAALEGRARRREAAGDDAGALEAWTEAARIRGEDDEGLERRAELARRAGDLAGAATLLLARARRAVAAGEDGGPERLVDAGLAALEGGLDAEGGAALHEALSLHPDPEATRAALAALGGRAQRDGDGAAEAAALLRLVPLLPAGERPARLARLSALRAAAGDVAGALEAAEAARTLAPRDLAVVHQARVAAEAAGDLPLAAARLADEAALDEGRAGPLLLDRARLLARLGDAAADDAYGEALRRLPPDFALAAEQARWRRDALPARPAGEPLEAFARRAAEPAAAARAWLAAAALALQAGDGGAALRCARRGYGRSRATPARAGPLLARLLYLQGASAEALVLHRALLEQGFPGFDDGDVVALCRQLGELAEEAGELELARAALDRLLSLRPQDAEAARRRFLLDPERRRAVAALAEVAGRVRSEARRGDLLALAGEAALAELGDRKLGERLFREALAEVGPAPRPRAALERRRAAATRAADPGPEALLAALHDAAEASQAAGETAAARDLYEEAVAEERRRGMRGPAARDLLQLEALFAAEGDFAAAAARAAQAGGLLAEAGDLAGAAEALRRATADDPGDARALARLAEVSAALGAEGAESLAGALADLAARATPGAPRAAALVRLAAAEADALRDDARAEATLRAALAEAPGDPAAEGALLALLARAGRDGERARLILERAGRQQDAAVRAGLRREAARLLGASADPADRSLAADALAAVTADLPDDAAAARAAASALAAAGRRDEAVARLTAQLRADPGDEATAAELLRVLADRPAERAELLVDRAARVAGEARAARLRQAAAAFTEAGDEPRAAEALLLAFDAWPADDAAFRAALEAATASAERLDAVLQARAAAVPAEAPSCHRARADSLYAAGRIERAIAAYEAALLADPEDPAALASLAAGQASLGGPAAARAADRRLCDLAEARPGLVPASLEAVARYRLGLHPHPEATAAAVRADLARAVELAPGDARAPDARAVLRPAPALEEAVVQATQATPAAAAPPAPAPPPAAAPAPAAPPEVPHDELPALDLGADWAAELSAGLPPLEEPADLRAEAQAHAVRAAQATDPVEQAAAWLASAEALARGGAPADELRPVIALACDADPDGPAPWQALARLETSDGHPLDAARAHLAVSIRAEGEVASLAALTAARLFEEEGRHADAARSYRAANLARPRAVPPALILAEEALAAGDPVAAAEQLRLVDPDALPPDAHAAWRRASARVGAPAGPPGGVPEAFEPPGALHAPPADLADPLAALVDALAPGPAGEPAPAAALADPIALGLRGEADAAAGAERTAFLERLAGHLERTGDAGGAADALMEALVADPERDLTWSWLESLVAQDPERSERAARLRAGLGGLGHEPPPGDLPPVDLPPVDLPALDLPPLDLPPLEPPPAEPPPAAGAEAEAAPTPEPGPAAAPRSAPLRTTTAPWVPVSEPPAAAPESAPPESAPPESAPPESAAPEQRPAPPPDRASLLRSLVREHAAAGNRRALWRIAPEAESLLGREALRPFATSIGRAALEGGDAAAAHAWLTLAREDDPEELTLARDLSRAAEKLGRHDEELALGELCAEAIAPHDPLAAAARFRHFARVAAEQLDDPRRALLMAEKAAGLAPDDAETRRLLWSMWGRHAETAPRALEAWLEAARQDPADGAALGEVASLCERLAAGAPRELAARLRERGRLAASLAAFASPGRSAPLLRLAGALPEAARDRVAAPGSTGPLARLLALLAPWLEPLFPADLARRGATAADRLVPPRAPVLRDALEAAGRALGARAHASFLVDRPGAEILIENTQPPSLVIPSGLAALPEAVTAFLAARALDLLGRGWALTGRFAPRDVGILLELACRFAGGVPPPLGLPAQRADAFLAALQRSVPPAIAEKARRLGQGAAEELAGADLAALAASLRRTGGRVALLATGDPGAALAALLLVEGAAGERPGAAVALARPELRDLALLALSDPFLDLRVQVLG